MKSLNRRQFVGVASLSSLASLFTGINPAIGKSAPSEPPVPADKATWKKINGTIYGAKADDMGPLGGGKSYKKIVTKGDYTVEDLESLLDALTKVKSGQVVFIPSTAVIDMTTFIHIHKTVLNLPAGVTLASDRGHNGSLGGMITSDTLDTPKMIEVLGPGVRITGIRLQGPNPKRYLDHHKRAYGPGGLGEEYYYKFPRSIGIACRHPELEVDNCEISAFSSSGISLNFRISFLSIYFKYTETI